MKPEDNKPVNDLDADLSSIEQAYRASARDEPPAMVDQSILNKARLAAESKTKGWHFAGFRWVSAFATASVVVVSLALVMEQTTRPPPLPDMPSSSSTRAESFEVDFLRSDDADRTLESSNEAPPAAEAEIRGLLSKQALSSELKIDSRSEAQTPGRSSLEESAISAVAPAPAERPRQNNNMTEEEEQEYRQSGFANMPLRLEKAASDSDVQQPPVIDEALADEPMPNIELDVLAVSGVAPMPEPPPPEVWIRRIMRWKHLQLTEKFERELAEFRKVYPDYELPEELGIK